MIFSTEFLSHSIPGDFNRLEQERPAPQHHPGRKRRASLLRRASRRRPLHDLCIVGCEPQTRFPKACVYYSIN